MTPEDRTLIQYQIIIENYLQQIAQLKKRLNTLTGEL